MPKHEPHTGASGFEARCRALIDGAKRAVRTQPARAATTVTPPNRPPADLFGALRGSVRVTPGVDLTEPTGETWEANG